MNKLTVGISITAAFLVVVALFSFTPRANAQDMSQHAARSAVSAAVWNKMLKMKLWVIETHDVPGAVFTQEVGRAHVEHQIQLEKQGVMFAAGGVRNAKGEREYGMIVIRAASYEAAQKIADSDPMHIAKVRAYTLHEWTINEGQIKLTVNFSDGTYTFE